MKSHLENRYYQTEQGYHGQCAAMINFDSRPWLPEINIPALILVGSHDLVALPEESFEIARLIPNAQIKIIHNAGHNPEAEESGIFIKELSTFITNLDSDVFMNQHLYRNLSKF